MINVKLIVCNLKDVLNVLIELQTALTENVHMIERDKYDDAWAQLVNCTEQIYDIIYPYEDFEINE